MVSAPINNAVSGLQASSLRLENSANNVANIASTVSRIDGERVLEPFRPQDVVQQNVEPGGVRAELRPREPASVPVFDPDNVAANAEGVTEFPNVDLEEEIIDQQIATYDFQANLRVIEAADEQAEELLNIVA